MLKVEDSRMVTTKGRIVKVFAMLALFASFALNAGQTVDLGRDGVDITVESEPEVVDVGRDLMVTITVVAPTGMVARLPDLRERFKGFQVAEDVADDPILDTEGKETLVTRWSLRPEPMAKRYRLAPFVVTTAEGSFYTAPVVFNPPAAREAVTGGMEINPKRDFPSLSWRLVGIGAAILAVLALVVTVLVLIVRKIRMMVRIHRMSPIERAMYELDVLLKKGLPGRGFYKDFYIELTMVVRRYIERRHEVRAPNLTTDEFLRAAESSPAFTREAIAELREFLQSADMVKFAGVEATPEMADAATSQAKVYLKADSKQPTAGNGNRQQENEARRI